MIESWNQDFKDSKANRFKPSRIPNLAYVTQQATLVVHREVPVEKLPEFIAWLRDVYGDEALGLGSSTSRVESSNTEGAKE